MKLLWLTVILLAIPIFANADSYYVCKPHKYPNTQYMVPATDCRPTERKALWHKQFMDSMRLELRSAKGFTAKEIETYTREQWRDFSCGFENWVRVK